MQELQLSYVIMIGFRFASAGGGTHIRGWLHVLLGVVLSLLLALPALAYRREYTTTFEGERKAGSEVCFYRGIRGDAFSLFFAPSDVACLSADAILDFPPGLIHAFARHKDGYASLQRDYAVHDGPPNPGKGYEKLEIPMVRAGVVDFGNTLKGLRTNQRLGLWIASAPTSAGTFVPLVPGETTILAPVEMIVAPLLIEEGIPARVGEVLYLVPGEEQAALFHAEEDSSDVIVWTLADAEALKDVRSQIAAPTITIRVGGRAYKPIAPLYAPGFNTLLIFRGIPRGKAILTVEGRMWKPVTREISVLSHPVTIEREAVPLIAGGSITAQWSSEGAQPTPECPHARTSDLPLVRAGLLRCTTTPEGEKKCSTVGKTTTPYGAKSSVTFTGIPTGSYSVLIEPPYGKRQSLATEVIAGRLTTVDVNIPSFSFFGSVKLNGQPIHARLIFASGHAVTDPDGRYTATLAADPRDNQIKIELCDDPRTFTFIPHASPPSNAVYDVDLRLARLDVKVIDSDDVPVADASVRFSPIKQIHADGNEMYFASADKQTDAEGHAVFDDVPDGFKVSVCAAHKRFGRKCSALLDLKELGDRAAVVQFDPVRMRGRVQGHSGQGVITIVSPAGSVLEEARLDDDGTFLLRALHSAPEYLIYVCATRPLTVLPLPIVPPDDLVIVVPATPARTFTVTVPNMKPDFGFVGVWVGGRYVPLQVLNTNQEMRGLDSVLYRDKSLEIRDIAESGPITVAFAAADPVAKHFVDVFTLPQYAGVARVSVASPSVVLSQ